MFPADSSSIASATLESKVCLALFFDTMSLGTVQIAEWRRPGELYPSMPPLFPADVEVNHLYATVAHSKLIREGLVATR